MSKFRVGDRIRTTSDPNLISNEFVNLTGVITEINLNGTYRARMDNKPSPASDKAWGFTEIMLDFDTPEPTDEEIRALFSVKKCHACGRDF